MTDMTRMPGEGGIACHEVGELLSAYLDDELAPRRTAEVSAHLERCVDCRRDLARLRRTGDAIRQVLAPPATPDVLRARVRAAIREADPPAAGVRPGPEPASRRRRRWRWPAVAAAGLGIAVASSAITIAVLKRPAAAAPELAAHEAVQSHVRALMSGRMIDVASSDQHTVKPWFNGRVDFSPDVPRLDSLGFPLRGGRLDHVGDQPVAALVYGRRKHLIDVFTRPWATGARSIADTAVITERGYHVLHWAGNGMEFWAVSDLSVPDLRLFATAFARTAYSEPPPGSPSVQ